MANHIQLQEALRKPYNRLLFAKEVLSPVFGSTFKLATNPIEAIEKPTKQESSVLNKILIYGNIQLEDGTPPITCYEITLQPKVRIEHNKVAISKYIRKLLATGDAALVNFISPKNENNNWRFSFISKDSILSDDGIIEKYTNSKRFTFIVEIGADKTNRTLTQRLQQLSVSNLGLGDLEEAFSVEKMSKAFFDEYFIHYEKFIAELVKSSYRISIFKKDEKAIRDFVKKLLGRIVFLYFVQKKGWLGATTTKYEDGSEYFIMDLFKQSGGNEAFYSVWLRKLFFEALNQDGNVNLKRADDNFKMPNGEIVKIPYLNGGLFDMEVYDDKILTFESSLFHNEQYSEEPKRRGFLDFLNSFNFTVYEDSPDDHTIAVDPEMLGHIFENLLEENRKKGAFYTPKEIVHYMCQESLIEYLTINLSKDYKIYIELGKDQFEFFGNETKIGQLNMMEEFPEKVLNRSEVEEIVRLKDITGLTDEHLVKINDLLDKVKICDPAIGSGAFPMGLLQEIINIKEAIAFKQGKEINHTEVKENIIQNSIYGVDNEKGAVDIARLRFWLSLIVDEDIPKPLPNLDYKIVVGDSLVSVFDDQVIDIDWDVKFKKTHETEEFVIRLKDNLNQLIKYQHQYFKEPTNKHELKQKIRKYKIEILINIITLDLIKFKVASNEMLDMFEDIENKTTRDKKRKDLLKNKVTILNSSLLKLQKLKNNNLESFNFFDWKLDFPEVLNERVTENIGFDIVIANPPYIKEYTNKEAFKHIKGRPYYQGKMDIWYYFGSVGLDLLKEGGVQTFIAQNNWVTSSGASKLRNKILSESEILNFVDFNNYKVFKSAGIQTMIFLLKKTPPEQSYKTYYSHLETEYIPDNFLSKYLVKSTESSNLYNKYYLEFIPQNYKDSFITFNSPNIEYILNLIKEGDKTYLKENEVAQGIVTPQDFLNKSNAEYLGKGYSEGEGIFILKDEELKALKLTNHEKTLVKPFYSTKNLFRFFGNKINSEWIIYTTSDAEDWISNYPKIKQHLYRFKDIITSTYGPYGLHRARDENFFKGEKILSLRKCEKPTFTYVNFDSYVLQTYFVIKTSRINNKYLTAILNSKVVAFWLRNRGKLQGTLYQIDKEPLLAIPIPMPLSNKSFVIETIVDYLIYLYDSLSPKVFTNTENIKLTPLLEDLLNMLVYEQYFEDLMKKEGISILEYIRNEHMMNFGQNEKEKITLYIKSFYEWLQQSDNPIRNRIILSNINSSIISNINAFTH